MIYRPLIKYATIMVSVIPMMIIYPFVQKYFVSGVMIGAVKG
jgi:putative aldouronate transport system permease protein